MRNLKQTMALAIILAVAGLTTAAQAQWQRWDRRDTRQVGQILARIDQRAVRFQNSLERAVNQSRMDNTQREDRINRLVGDFRQALTQLRDRYNRRQAADADVQALLDSAARIDNFMQRRQPGAAADSDWQALRGDLDSLAGAYNIAWNWDRDSGGGGRGSSVASRLSGTFRLNTAQSDNARLIVERAVRDLPYSDRQRATEMLLRRVDAPEEIAIDKQGRTITLASSRAPQMSFDADGQEHVEQTNSGRQMRVTASLTGDQLNINTSGDRASDFSVTFDPINNGRQLRVTRRLSSERLNQEVVVQSTYDQVSPTARWEVYNGSNAGNRNDRYPNDRGGNYDSNYDFVVPDGTPIVARLNENLDTTRTRSGDRFTLTVVSPPEYRDAIIEGHIIDANRSGRVTGRAELALAFDSIRTRNGRTSRFEGTLESVRAANGDNIRVDSEGAVRDSSQTNRTVTRTAIGSAIGAVIGAVAGGGKGAAVGAVVGGGAGAGSVFIQGRNDLQLTNGTEITIRASAPNRRAER